MPERPPVRDNATQYSCEEQSRRPVLEAKRLEVPRSRLRATQHVVRAPLAERAEKPRLLLTLRGGAAPCPPSCNLEQHHGITQGYYRIGGPRTVGDAAVGHKLVAAIVIKVPYAMCTRVRRTTDSVLHL